MDLLLTPTLTTSDLRLLTSIFLFKSGGANVELCRRDWRMDAHWTAIDSNSTLQRFGWDPLGGWSTARLVNSTSLGYPSSRLRRPAFSHDRHGFCAQPTRLLQWSSRWYVSVPDRSVSIRHCGLVGSAPAWDGTGCEFDSWQCQIYIPCSLSLRLLGLFGVFWVHMAWHKNCVENKKKSVLCAAVRLVLGLPKWASVLDAIHDKLHWLPFPKRVELKLCSVVYKYVHDTAPRYLSQYCIPVGFAIERRRCNTSIITLNLDSSNTFSPMSI